MEDTRKAFACTVEGCSMHFNNEENLTLHRRKHDMVLNLENGQKTNIFVADQTPTPTRFIRNCEEVGLFQDLQNVNPFEETFRKAVEASRVGGSHLEVDSLHIPAAADDTLHTPHVFPNITEEHNSITNLISSTPVTVETQSGEKSQSRDELEPLQVSSILQSESSITEGRTTSDLGANIDISELENTEVLVVKQESDTSQQILSRASSVDSGCKISTTHAQDTVQVVIRMPDGRLVQLSGVSMDSVPSTQVQVSPTVVQTAALPQTSTSNAVIFNTQLVQTTATSTQVTGTTQQSVVAAACGIPISSSSAPDIVNTCDARLFAAKMKLKQRIQFNSKRKEVSSEESNQMSARKGSAMRTLRAPSSEGSDTNSGSSKRKRTNTSTDVDEQKLRFRERNRAAAMRCREKRKHWILELEKRADDTQRMNQQLTAEVTRLRSELMQLKTLLLAHKDCSVTKAMQQGVRVIAKCNNKKTSPIQIQIQPSAVSIQEMPVTISGSINVCASPEDPLPKVVLLSKPKGLKRRRPAALAAGLTIVENGALNSNDSHVKQPNAAHATVSQPISITAALPDSSQICSNPEENPKSYVSDSVVTQPTCLIAMTAPALIPAGITTQGITIKPGSVTSTSYLMPTKLCLPNDSTLPQVIKFNPNNLKSVPSETVKTSSVSHANGDSMDSGHGSDIEILAEIPAKQEVKS